MSTPNQPPATAEGDDDLLDEELRRRLDRLAPPADVASGLQIYHGRRKRRMRNRRAVFAGAASVALLTAALGAGAVVDRSRDQDVIIAGPPSSQDSPTSSSTAAFATSTTEPWKTPTTRPHLAAPAVDRAACPQYEPGPTQPTPPGFSATGDDDPRLRQSAMSQGQALPSVEVLQQYAKDNPDGFFEVGLEWVGTTAAPLISYSKDIEKHCADIAALLGDDVHWVMRWNAYSEAELRQLATELGAALQPFAFDFNNGVLTVMLEPDQRWLADRLLELNSPKLAVTLGAHPYPDPASSTSTCSQLDRSAEHASKLTAQLVTKLTLKSGSRADVEVELTNPSDRAISVDQPLNAYLGDGKRILSINGNRTNDLVVRSPVIIEAGQSIRVQLSLSTATCDPRDGYQLPPGTYALDIPVGVDWTSTAITVRP